MTLKEWLDANHPGRGGRAWLVREAPTSHETLKRILDEGEPLNGKKTAERISEATGGAVTVASLMGFAPTPRSQRARRAS
jgi:hypothetical protein